MAALSGLFTKFGVEETLQVELVRNGEGHAFRFGVVALSCESLATARAGLCRRQFGISARPCDASPVLDAASRSSVLVAAPLSSAITSNCRWSHSSSCSRLRMRAHVSRRPSAPLQNVDLPHTQIYPDPSG